MSAKLSYSVILPFHQESAEYVSRNAQTVLDIFDQLHIPIEVILVDDTGKSILKSSIEKNERITVVTNNRNSGKGFSIKKAIEFIKNDIALYTDIDLPVDLDYFLRIVSQQKDYDLSSSILIGDRSLHTKKCRTRKTSVSRIITGHLFKLVVYILSGGKLYDTQCPFKVMSRKNAQKLFSCLTITGYAFDFELLTTALEQNYHLVRVPVLYKDGRKKMSWLKACKQTGKMIYDILLYKIKNASTER